MSKYFMVMSWRRCFPAGSRMNYINPCLFTNKPENKTNFSPEMIYLNCQMFTGEVSLRELVQISERDRVSEVNQVYGKIQV